MATLSTESLKVHKLLRAGQQRLALKNEINRLITTLTAGANSTEVIRALRFLAQVVEPFQSLIDDPDLVQIAKDVHEDQTYDIVSEYGGLITAINLALAEINNTIPKNAGGFVLLYEIDAGFNLTPRNFTGAQLTTVVNNLNNILAAIG